MTVNASRQVRDVVVVAASAGGLEPLRTLCSTVAPDLPAGIAVVLHRNPYADGMILPVLRKHAAVPVVEPREGEPFARGTVFIAPRDRHLLLEDGAFHLSRGPKQHALRPAADPLFSSAAQAYGERVLAVVLSGGGFDGASGCLAVKDAGGVVLAQDLKEADMPFMPLHTIQKDHVDAVLPLPKLIEAIAALAGGREIEV